MRYLLGLSLLIVFVGCRSTPGKVEQAQNETPAAILACAPISVSALPMRVGLEYLPPKSSTRDRSWSLMSPSVRPWREDRESQLSLFATPRQVSVMSLRPTLPEEPLTRNNHLVGQFEQALRVDKDVLSAIEDPLERMTMLFVRDLIGEDRRRLSRELGASVLTRKMLRHDDTTMLHSRFQEVEEEQEARFLEEEGRSLLRRPLRKLLKKNTFIGDIKVMIDEFKADNIPLSSPYEEDNPKGWGWGSVSMRVKVRKGSDPLELSYRNWGWKVGSSKEKAKIRYRINLTDDLEAGMKIRYDYDQSHTQFQVDLHYTINPNAQLYMVIADRLNYLSGPTASSFMSSPMDGQGGIMFYVEHLF